MTDTHAEQPGLILLEAIIDALRLNHLSLRTKAEQTLHCMGPGLIPLLVAVASRTSTSASHRRRIHQVIEHMPPSETRGAIAPAVIDVLRSALQSGDQPLLEKALEASRWNCPDLFQMVLLQLTTVRRRPAWRIRVLRAISQVGLLDDPRYGYALEILSADRNQAVRQAAEEVISELP